MSISDIIKELADILISYIESKHDFCEEDSNFINKIYDVESKLNDYKKLEQKESR